MLKEESNIILKNNLFENQNYIDKNNISIIQNMKEQLNSLSLKLDRREDDIKNIINEKDLMIHEINQKLKEQEIIINMNKDQIKGLNKQLKDLNKQIYNFKNFEYKIKKMVNYDEKIESYNKKLNDELSKVEKNLYNNNFENENLNNEDITSNEEDSLENENIYYDEYEDILDKENIIVNKIKKHKKNNTKNKEKKEIFKEQKDNSLISQKDDSIKDEDYILIGKKIPNFKNNLKEKILTFESEIIKSEEQFLILQKSIQFHLLNMKLNINFELVDKLEKFPLNIEDLKENEDLLLNEDLLFIVETLDNKIICLGLNNSNLPSESFYLFLNDNKIFYYRKKKKDEKRQKNEIYRDEECHARYKYNKETIENIGELKSYFFQGYFRFINNNELSKFKIIEIFQILYK